MDQKKAKQDRKKYEKPVMESEKFEEGSLKVTVCDGMTNQGKKDTATTTCTVIST